MATNRRSNTPLQRRRRTHAAVSSAILAGLALAQSAPASADPPVHSESTLTESTTIAAGEFCDVAVREDIVYTDRSTTIGDPDDPDRVIVRARVTFTYSNLDTGASVTDDGRFVFTIEDGGARFVVRGLGTKLRDSSGRLVAVDSGRVVLDGTTGEVISATPSRLQDYEALVCTNLGAAPSS